MTSAPLPAGADAVLPAELAETIGDELRVQGEVSPGKHVGRRGEDVQAGDAVLPAGRVLRPQDLGVLASIGMESISVRSLAAASSTRSMALSGRKRSEM